MIRSNVRQNLEVRQATDTLTRLEASLALRKEAGRFNPKGIKDVDNVSIGEIRRLLGVVKSAKKKIAIPLLEEVLQTNGGNGDGRFRGRLLESSGRA